MSGSQTASRKTRASALTVEQEHDIIAKAAQRAGEEGNKRFFEALEAKFMWTTEWPTEAGFYWFAGE